VSGYITLGVCCALGVAMIAYWSYRRFGQRIEQGGRRY
jgi:hypothetical protein